MSRSEKTHLAVGIQRRSRLVGDHQAPVGRSARAQQPPFCCPTDKAIAGRATVPTAGRGEPPVAAPRPPVVPASAIRRRRAAGKTARQEDVVARRGIRNQVEELKHEADLIGRKRSRACAPGASSSTGTPSTTRRRLQHTADDRQQRGLAAAAGPWRKGFSPADIENAAISGRLPHQANEADRQSQGKPLLRFSMATADSSRTQSGLGPADCPASPTKWARNLPRRENL